MGHNNNSIPRVAGFFHCHTFLDVNTMHLHGEELSVQTVFAAQCFDFTPVEIKGVKFITSFQRSLTYDWNVLICISWFYFNYKIFKAIELQNNILSNTGIAIIRDS